MDTTDATNRLKGLQEKATEMAVSAGKSTDFYVRENTWMAIGMAALLGCVVGYLLSNSTSSED